MVIFTIFEDFINLFFPLTCASCGNNLLKNEKAICTHCLYHIPKTNYHFEKDNPISKLFWGRVNIENATAFYFFQKGSKFQKLIHYLKYKGHKEIGYELGKIFGFELVASSLFNMIDLIIPVPLHPRKEKKRGFNQSEVIAKGISESMRKPVMVNLLYRTVEAETQTRKSRFERWKNVEEIFQVGNYGAIKNKHILLVDDVVTTGSTLESCAIELLKAENTKVSVATIAVA